MNFLVLPGLSNSNEQHWQTVWERSIPNFYRVQQSNWDNPEREDWVVKLEEAVVEKGACSVVIAHSLGCLLLAHWAFTTKLSIKGALLVAPPNPLSAAYPIEAKSFSAFPQKTLPFESIMVASLDDPYSDNEFSRQCAKNWGSDLICVGAAGHINANSNLGEWVEGQQILARLVSKVTVP